MNILFIDNWIEEVVYLYRYGHLDKASLILENNFNEWTKILKVAIDTGEYNLVNIIKNKIELSFRDINCSSSRQKLCGDLFCKKCYNKSFLSHEKAKYWSKRNGESPRQVFKNSHSLKWFDCEICKHEFKSRLADVNRGRWCFYCTSSHRKLCNSINCGFCFNNSFASHPKAKFWSEKNKETPRQVTKNCNSKKWFDCEICKHEFEASLNNINNGRWCPYCACPCQKLCNSINCDFCWNNSFASHPKAKFWSEKNKETPRQVTKNCNSKKWFDCGKCKHEFETGPSSVNTGSWCPYCSNPCKKLCNTVNCEFCWNNSFSSHQKAEFWSEKNKETPRQVTKNCSFKFWFDCETCKHEFEIRLVDVNRGQWCPICKNKTERKLLESLKKDYPQILRQFKPSWSINKETGYPFLYDYSIFNNIIIELDGRQHFQDVLHWKSSCEENLERDILKINLAIQNNFSVIRVVQEEIWNDKYDWRSEITKAISFLENKLPTLYLISVDKTIYEKHNITNIETVYHIPS